MLKLLESPNRNYGIGFHGIQRNYPEGYLDYMKNKSETNPAYCCGSRWTDAGQFEYVNKGVTICLSDKVETIPESSEYITDSYTCEDGTVINFKFNMSEDD